MGILKRSSIAASVPSVPLAFSALLVAICSQAKARFLPGTERLNLALTAMGTSLVKSMPFVLKRSSFKFAPSFAPSSSARFVFSGALAFFRICAAFAQVEILSPAVVAEILPQSDEISPMLARSVKFLPRVASKFVVSSFIASPALLKFTPSAVQIPSAPKSFCASK